MQRHDVLIVGGGPAGSSCAWALRESGIDVAIIDRKDFPRDKTCAGWVTPAVMQTLNIDLQDYAQGRTIQPILGFRTGIIGGEEVENHYEEPVSYGIRRCEFDHYLLQRSGVTFHPGVNLKSMQRIDSRWRINDTFETDLLIGAGGHFCPVARELGNRCDPQASVVRAQEIEFLASNEDLAEGTITADTPELFFCEDLKGYGWCFRKGDYLNIGLGRTEADSLSQHVNEFCTFLKERGKITCDISEKFHGHAYQLYELITPQLVGESILLIGDAAGLAYPQSGEGIRPAVESGLIAAEIIRQTGGKPSADDLQVYAARIRERLGKPRSKAISGKLPQSWMHFLATRLMSSRWFARNVVIDKWFLHADQPVLIP